MGRIVAWLAAASRSSDGPSHFLAEWIGDAQAMVDHLTIVHIL
jgi:hypothetical protein